MISRRGFLTGLAALPVAAVPVAQALSVPAPTTGHRCGRNRTVKCPSNINWWPDDGPLDLDKVKPQYVQISLSRIDKLWYATYDTFR